jgi:hypothetical protein
MTLILRRLRGAREYVLNGIFFLTISEHLLFYACLTNVTESLEPVHPVPFENRLIRQSYAAAVKNIIHP